MCTCHMVLDICNLVVTPRSLPTKPRDGSEMTVLFCQIQLSRSANPPNLNRICSTSPSQPPAEFRQWMLVFRAHPLTIPDCLEYFCPPDHTYAALWRVNKQTLKNPHPPATFSLCNSHGSSRMPQRQDNANKEPNAPHEHVVGLSQM